MKILIIAVALSGALLGCQPGDPHAKTVRQRVLDGETVTFTKPGYTLCGKSAWTDMRLSDPDERERVVLGKQGSVLSPGHSACYRIGDTVDLNVVNQQLSGGGQVRIESLSLSLLDRLSARTMQGLYFASSGNFAQYKSAVAARQRADQEGMVTVVNVSYQAGTAADEASIRAKDTAQQAGDGYEETTGDGQYLPSSSGCKKPYTYIAVPGDLQASILDGSLKSWYVLGESTCLKQGQTADLSLGKDVPPLGKARVVKLKKFRLGALEPKYFTLAPTIPFETLSARIASENTKGATWIVVIDFEVTP